jgi:hypothetical protein
MANCKYVEDLKSVVSDYFKNVDKIVQAKSQANQSLKGDSLTAELNRLGGLESAEYFNTNAKMKAIHDAKCSEYEKQKQEQLSGNIPADINLLSAPVTLTADELQNLADRHKDNYIMQRAIRERGEKQNILVNIAPGPNEKIKDAGDLLNHFKSYTTLGIGDAETAQHKENERHFGWEAASESCYKDFDRTLAD